MIIIFSLTLQKRDVEYGSRTTSLMNVAHQISPLDIIMLNGSRSPCRPWLCTVTKAQAAGEKEISHTKQMHPRGCFYGTFDTHSVLSQNSKENGIKYQFPLISN